MKNISSGVSVGLFFDGTLRHLDGFFFGSGCVSRAVRDVSCGMVCD